MDTQTPPYSTIGAGSLAVESGIIAPTSQWGTDVRMVGHVHPWGWK